MARKRKKYESGVFKSGKDTFYRDTLYRSRWEVYVAKLLYTADIHFMYEPMSFRLPIGITYVPDFYLPSYKTWIEVKGSLSSRDKLKLYYFMKNHKLLYLGKEELEHISGRPVSFLSKPDIINYQPTSAEVERFRRLLYA
jgi:hypothetical protein